MRTLRARHRGAFRFMLRFSLVAPLGGLLLALTPSVQARQAPPADVDVFNDHRVQAEVFHFARPADPGVDAYGDLSLSVPAMTVPGRGIDFPITFSYRSGITVDERPSWVGLGWGFDPGSVTRSPEGGGAVHGHLRRRYGVDVFDDPSVPAAQPDAYYVSLPGRGTVAVTRSNNPAFNPVTTPAVSEGSFVVEEHTPWKIEPSMSGPVTVAFENRSGQAETATTGTREFEEGDNPDEGGSYVFTARADYHRFVVTAEDGARYVFARPTLSYFDAVQKGSEGLALSRQTYVAAWRLVAILGADFDTDAHEIPDDFTTPWPADAVPGSWVRFEYAARPGAGGGAGAAVLGLREDDPTVHSTNSDVGAYEVKQATYLAAIHTPTHRAEFVTAERYDPQSACHAGSGEECGNDDQFLNRRLTAVRLYSKLASPQAVLEEVVLEQAQKGSGLGPTKSDGSWTHHRLRLDAVRYYGAGGAAAGPERPGYAFGYGAPGTDENPTVSYDDLAGSRCRDDLGYFRAEAVCGDDAAIDAVGGAAWSLREMTHPTGAADAFAYETDRVDENVSYYIDGGAGAPVYVVKQNDGTYNEARHRQGGARLTEHLRDDGMGAAGSVQRTTYVYGQGRLTGVPLGYWKYREPVYARQYRLFAPSNRGKVAVAYASVGARRYDGGELEGETRTHYSQGAPITTIVVRRFLEGIYIDGQDCSPGHQTCYADLVIAQGNEHWRWGKPYKTEYFGAEGGSSRGRSASRSGRRTTPTPTPTRSRPWPASGRRRTTPPTTTKAATPPRSPSASSAT